MPHIVPFADLTDARREDAARLLLEAFIDYPAGYQTIEDARREVAKFFDDADRRAWACVDGDQIVGWIGRIIDYRGNVWELHPLLVTPAYQRCGLGRLLVETLEAAAREAGVGTITLGADDETNGTNVFGADLYPEVWRHIREIAPTNGHALSFYQKMGYVVYGILPDANGPGRHDILMAKRIR